MKWLHREVKNHTDSDAYPFHMPGGKGRSPLSDEIAGYDITEISGFDDLRHPDDVIKELEDGWAKLYGAGKAHLLVNGSTCGNLAMLYAATTQKGSILVAGRHHWSIDNAAEIRELEVISFQPDQYQEGFDKPIAAQGIRKTLEQNPKTECVVITSPTYEGVVSDIRSIADTVHNFGIPLIVDCAHGAHMGISGEWQGTRASLWNDNPINCGADAVVVSLHKTLPVMGQVSLVMTPEKEGFIKDSNLKHYINIFQTSSPSYVLMSSASRALEVLTDKSRKLSVYQKSLIDELYESTEDLQKIQILKNDNIELSKIIISTKNHKLSGFELEKKLRQKYSIFIEKATENYVIAMTSVYDRKEGFDRLKQALYEIDKEG